MTKNKPEIRFSSFESMWIEQKFDNVLKSHSYKPYLTNPCENGTYPIIQQGENPLLGFSDGEPFENYGDVILFGDHTLSVYKPKMPFFVATDGVKILSAKGIDGILLTPLFEKYVPKSQGYKRHYTILRNEFISYPLEIEEQTKIGSFFKNLDDIISLHQQELEALKQTKQGFLQKMFPSEIGVMPDIRFESSNSDWEIYKLSELGETFTGLSGLSKDDFNDGECKYVTYMNVFSNTIIDINNLSAVNLSKNKKQNKLKSGDILFTTSSEKAEEVGMASYFGHNLDNVYLNSFCFGFRPNNSKVDSLFLAYFMRSNMIRTRLNKLAQGSTRYNLSKTEMMKMTISLPSLSEQLKIRALFRKLDEIIELKEKELEALKETKKGFLQKMFV